MAATFTMDRQVWLIGTDAERSAMGSPGAGAVFFAHDTGITWVYTGTGWVTDPSSSGSGAGTPASGVPGATTRVRATLNAVSPGIIAAAGDYVAGDVLNQSTTVGVHWVLPSIARVIGSGGLIYKILANVSVAAMVPRLRLHLFNAVPTVLQNDNVALLLDLDDRNKYVGYIDLPAFQTSGSSEFAWAEADISWVFNTALDRNLYMVVQTLDAFTNESAGMTLDFVVTAVQT